MTVTKIKQSLNGKTGNENKCPRQDLNLESLNKQPTQCHYYCRHRTLFENMVLLSLVFLNIRVAYVTSRRLLDCI